MTSEFAQEVERFQSMRALDLLVETVRLEREMSDVQRRLAAARKAQKNQKRAAKNVIGSRRRHESAGIP